MHGALRSSSIIPKYSLQQFLQIFSFAKALRSQALFRISKGLKEKLFCCYCVVGGSFRSISLTQWGVQETYKTLPWGLHHEARLKLWGWESHRIPLYPDFSRGVLALPHRMSSKAFILNDLPHCMWRWQGTVTMEVLPGSPALALFAADCPGSRSKSLSGDKILRALAVSLKMPLKVTQDFIVGKAVVVGA